MPHKLSRVSELLVTGGAGFIGSNFVHHVLGAHRPSRHRARQADVRRQPRLARRPARGSVHASCRATSATPTLVDELVAEHDVVVHFAAESHNDNSLRDPSPVPADQPDRHVHAARGRPQARHALPPHLHRRGVRRPRARRPGAVHRGHAVQPVEPVLLDQGRLRPAGAGLGALASACRRRSATAPTTTGPTSTSRSSSRARSPTCSTAIRPKLYGAGQNVRDWIHADDHSAAVLPILEQGPDRRDLPDRRRRREEQQARSSRLILELLGQPADAYDHVTDRAGHDLRYAIDSTKLRDRARLGAAVPRLRGRPGRHHRLVPRQRGLVAPAEGRDRGQVRGAGPVTMAIEFSSARRARDPDPRPAGRRPAGPRRQPRLVQGELAAGQDARARAARLRPGAEQRLVQRHGRRHPRHPRRAVGQVRLPRHRPDLRRLGRPARRAPASARCSPSSSDPQPAVFVPARRRQRLPDPGGRHRVLLPGQRPLEPPRQGRTPSSTSPTRPLAIAWPIPLEQAELSDDGQGAPAARRTSCRCRRRRP